ncbi:hypothetical protein SPRG_02004 [Saprolegnia parasitica CBS 223.65]|uniref:Trichohyalin-plectin-homology domain-containing protein n=1 Tax=Saprolegnia parasitica (strain CBS 223.65) TaxID=695850 RepID=A0A067D2G8_SAPPC|nr:hypothetical protein SPRG_02004 [Saprolegnia parasitica CBS 223.65]KDO33192.1 hypothetical protein SPRG_02004 [Saprolegnia parasitica CBS 223.65]|eukprot:XP_012195953.1 hypothetical protein SPRG_02004 [Saprolegnia parasitica CBS 223.65]
MSTSTRREKAEAILQRESVKSDKRAALEEVLVAKLVKKYALDDADFGRVIVSLVAKLVRSASKLIEADIAALEKTVKKLYDERGRKERHIEELKQRRPAPQDALDSKVAEFRPRTSQRGEPKKSPEVDLKTTDEWVLINALNIVEFEESEVNNLKKKHTKTVQQREWLDAQKREKERKLEEARRDKQLLFKEQVSGYDKWKTDEVTKSRKVKDAVDHIRMERDQQLRDAKLRQLELERKKQHEEALEVERCQRELRRVEEEALERKRAQHARMHALLKENSLVKEAKDKAKQLDMLQDVKMMDEYARKLEKEEADRVKALQHKLQRQDRLDKGGAITIHEQLQQKALEDDRRAEMYQRQKLETDVEREMREMRERKQEAMDRSQYLTFQHDLKVQKKQQQHLEELEYSRKCKDEGEAAQRETRHKLDIAKVRNKEYQALLLQQMSEQKGKKTSVLKAMDAREKSLNAVILRKLDDDHVSTKVVAKLSPDKIGRPLPRNNIF